MEVLFTLSRKKHLPKGQKKHFSIAPSKIFIIFAISTGPRTAYSLISLHS
jgi:hypothetical protein